jgi:hypothetical protein
VNPTNSRLENIKNSVNDVKDVHLSSAEHLEVLWNHVNNIKFGEINETLVEHYKKMKIITDVFFLHNLHELKVLSDAMFKTPMSYSPIAWFNFLVNIPTELITDYYGCSVGSYFTWLQHYTRSNRQQFLKAPRCKSQRKLPVIAANDVFRVDSYRTAIYRSSKQTFFPYS